MSIDTSFLSVVGLLVEPLPVSETFFFAMGILSVGAMN
jgi:hypothetical protein